MLFWLTAGWLASYDALPIGEVAELIICCFTGRLPQRLNRLQKNFQQASETDSRSGSQHRAKQLYKLNSKSQIYEGILGRLEIISQDSRERIARTIEALEHKRSQIIDELEPIKPSEYRRLDRLQQDLVAILASDVEKGYKSIEQIVYNLNTALKTSSSAITIEELLEKLSSEVSRNSKNVSPATLLIIRQLEELLQNSLAWGIHTDGRQLIENLSDLTNQRDDLASTVRSLSQENRSLIQQIEARVRQISKLEEKISELQLDSSELEQEVARLNQVNSAKQFRIDELSRANTQANNQNYDLRSQLNILDEHARKLSQERSSQQQRINQLIDHLNQTRHSRDEFSAEVENLKNQVNELTKQLFSAANVPTDQRVRLSGMYLGNTKNSSTKYHFKTNCPDWWGLAGQYLYGSSTSPSKNIQNSSSPQLFKDAGLEACRKCNGKSRSKR